MPYRVLPGSCTVYYSDPETEDELIDEENRCEGQMKALRENRKRFTQPCKHSYLMNGLCVHCEEHISRSACRHTFDANGCCVHYCGADILGERTRVDSCPRHVADPNSGLCIYCLFDYRSHLYFHMRNHLNMSHENANQRLKELGFFRGVGDPYAYV